MLRMLRWLMLAALAAFVIVTSAKALLAPLHVDEFPESLGVKAELMPVTFAVHMISGGLALPLAPLAFLLRPWPRWHRIAGRITALDVIVAGVTAYPVALVAPVTRGSAWGFAAQATVWLVLLVVCWPLALLALLLYPVFWILLLPFRLLGIAVDGLFETLRAVVMLPARVLGGPGH